MQSNISEKSIRFTGIKGAEDKAFLFSFCTFLNPLLRNVAKRSDTL